MSGAITSNLGLWTSSRLRRYVKSSKFCDLNPNAKRIKPTSHKDTELGSNRELHRYLTMTYVMTLQMLPYSAVVSVKYTIHIYRIVVSLI